MLYEVITIRSKSLNDQFELQIQFDASKPLNRVSDLLDSLIPNNEHEIFVSWGPKLAILTNREYFIRHWDEFCYPSSDDVEIYSPGNRFRLNYYHYEVFEFFEQKV